MYIRNHGCTLLVNQHRVRLNHNFHNSQIRPNAYITSDWIAAAAHNFTSKDTRDLNFHYSTIGTKNIQLCNKFNTKNIQLCNKFN